MPFDKFKGQITLQFRIKQMDKKIYLASKSPRRKELLATMVDSFEVLTALSAEQTNETEPERFVCDLASQKAYAVYKNLPKDSLVIGSDTIVVLNGRILGKPSDKEDAVNMLTLLSGRSHDVYSGVCIFCDGEKDCFFDRTVVTMRNLNLAEIEKYVDGGSPMDKAGAYGIQDSDFVSNIEGSFSCVMGFPKEKVSQHLGKYVKIKE